MILRTCMSTRTSSGSSSSHRVCGMKPSVQNSKSFLLCNSCNAMVPKSGKLCTDSTRDSNRVSSLSHEGHQGSNNFMQIFIVLPALNPGFDHGTAVSW